MKEEPNKDENDTSSTNILRITDELVRQIGRTKKFIIIMIIVFIVAIPVSWHVSPLLAGSANNFRLVGYVTIAAALVFLLIGVRQWLLFSKWTRRYKTYKELQERVDKKLDFEAGKEGT